MTKLGIRIGYDRPEEPARHVSGRRRSGLGSPQCPACGSLMLCIFSLDASDPVLAGSGLRDLGVDHDFFVCPMCEMYVYGYFVRMDANGVCRVEYSGWKETPDIVLTHPYPCFPIELVPEPGWDANTRRMECPFHMISGELPSDGELYEPIPPCPDCGKVPEQVVVIDSDEFWRFQERLEEHGELRSLNWVDGWYILVARCWPCGVDCYCLARG